MLGEPFVYHQLEGFIMAKKDGFSTAASAGAMPFSLVDLSELWANLRDGNYWSAVRRAIRMLDNILNPETGRTAVDAWTPDTGERVDEICCEMENWRDDFSQAVGSKVVTVKPELSEPNVSVVPIADILAIITLVLNTLREWRKRRAEPPTPPVTGVTGNVPPATTFGTKVPGKPVTRSPVFPANVEVKDKETAAQEAKGTAPKKPGLFGGTKAVAPAQPMTGNEPKPINPEEVHAETEAEHPTEEHEIPSEATDETASGGATTQPPPAKPASTPTKIPPRNPPGGRR